MMSMNRNIFLNVILMVSSLFDSVRPEIDFIAERLPLQGERPHPGSPWPMPKFWKRQEATLIFEPEGLQMTSDLENCEVVDQAFLRFVERLRVIKQLGNGEAVSQNREDHEKGNIRDKSDDKNMLREVKVHVSGGICPDYPHFGVDESYSLHITTKVFLNSSTVWGMIWGLETLSQLMYKIDEKWYINKGYIEDEPRFKHRGFHLDTARHFYSVDIMKKNLDAMSINKMNVFHWHIVDAQSFPYYSINFPQLADKGAFSPHHVYTQHDVREIIEYARMRGIRVLPEFDTPGHAHSWGKAMPELLTSCWVEGKPNSSSYSLHAERENFDPTKNSTFEFLAQFFEEIKEVFVDEFLHMGMDEAHYMCWQSSPDITEFMRSIGLKDGDYPGLEQYYVERLLGIIQALDRKTVVWEDPVNNGAEVPKNTLIQLWKDDSHWPGHFDLWQNYLKDAVKKGYDVIFSSCWYLSKINYGQDWKTFYTCDPFHINATVKELGHIVGGEACTWSEYIDDTNFLQTVWPRAAAVAERLWSQADVNDTDDASFRLDQHRCRLVKQGIPAQPILPGHCRDDHYNTDNAIIDYLQRQPHLKATTEMQKTSKTGGPQQKSTHQNETSTQRNLANTLTPTLIASTASVLFGFAFVYF